MDREIVMAVAGVAVVAATNHAAIVAEAAVDSAEAIAEAAEAAAAEEVDLLEAVSAVLHLALTIKCMAMIGILTKIN